MTSEKPAYCLYRRSYISVALMVLNLENMMETFGPAIILQCFHEFAAFQSAIRKVQRNIVESRKDRENRDNIYKTVLECDLPKLVDWHMEVSQSESIMIRVATDLGSEQKRNMILGYGGLIFGIVGVAVAIAAWKFPHLMGG